jgi:hypothetical protein
MNDLPWWDPAYLAISAIVDVLPAEQRDKIVAVWRAAAACREDKNDLMAAYFLHQLAGDEMPAPRPKPKLSHLKIIK